MVQEIVDFFRYGFDADGAVFVEAVARIAQEADGLQEIVSDNGHIDVPARNCPTAPAMPMVRRCRTLGSTPWSSLRIGSG